MTDTKNTVSDELLPCPFCGGAAEIEHDTPMPGSFTLGCTTDGCAATMMWAGEDREYLADAIASWNRRASVPGGVGVKLEWALTKVRYVPVDHPVVPNKHAEFVKDIEAILSSLDLSPAEPKALPERCPNCNLHWGYNPPALIAGTDQVRCIECKTLYAAPSNPVISDEMARKVIDDWDRNTCVHENMHRGGSIWTICDDCGRKWADDRGGFIPYSDPPGIAELRAALSVKPQIGENR